jgi:hypothetical protein
VITIMASPMRLTRRETLRWRSHSRSIGPKVRLRSSQAWARGEARTKQAAASSTKGVVGRPGTTMPIAPSANATAPPAHSSARTAGEPCRR